MAVDPPKPEMSKSPFGKFLSASLKDFEKHLRSIKQTEKTIDGRMRGAREFARFLVGNPASYNERTKGTI